MAAVLAPRRPPLARVPTIAAAVAVLGLACAAAPAPAAGAAAGAPAGAGCGPPGPQRSANLARADRADGTSEVTEILAGRRLPRHALRPRARSAREPDRHADPRPRRRPDARADRDRAARRHGVAPLRRSGRAELGPGLPRRPRGAARGGHPADGRDRSLPRAADARGRAAGRAAAPGDERRGRAGGGQLAAAAVAGDACSTTQYSFMGSPWTSRNYGYRVNRERFN